MELIRRLEQFGYQFDVRPTYKYIRSGSPPAAVKPLLDELATNREEAVLYVAERKLQPKHTRLSEQCRTVITKGILAAYSPYDMLIQAIQCISAMTGDSTFYTQSLANIKAIYGTGLSEPAPLGIELAEVRKRLAMLRRPELSSETADTRRRIDSAIREHQVRETQLIAAIESGKTDANDSQGTAPP